MKKTGGRISCWTVPSNEAFISTDSIAAAVDLFFVVFLPLLEATYLHFFIQKTQLPRNYNWIETSALAFDLELQIFFPDAVCTMATRRER